jgi:lysine 2,3-aminomutase
MDRQDWMHELANAACCARDFSRAFSTGQDYPDLGGLAARADLAAAHDLLPFLMPATLLSACQPVAGDPVLEQFLPRPTEIATSAAEHADPLDEGQHAISPRLIRQYPSRVVLRAGSACAAYCRFCFRRSMMDDASGFISDREIAMACTTLSRCEGIREILVSGGDPLVASDARLMHLLVSLRQALPAAVLRICSRVPIVLPARIDSSLLELFRNIGRIWFVVHINHPRELYPEAVAALRRISAADIPLLSQTVLLRGINDQADMLARLFGELVSLGIRPYYLFQGDLAAGTASFRVPLSQGLSIYAALRGILSGLELPRYAVDVPGGLGKAYLPEDIVGRTADGWQLASRSGRIGMYPEEA